MAQPSRPQPTVPTRERILAAAGRLFAEQGFGGVSMPAIAAASGITAGAIYRHFDSKADLFFEVVRNAVEATPVAPDGQGGVPALVADYTARRMKRLRQLAVEVHYAAAKDPKVGRYLRRALDVQMGEIRAAIAAGQASGAYDPAADPGRLSALVFVVIMGLMHAETLTPGLVGDPAWADFVAGRIAVMLGARGG